MSSSQMRETTRLSRTPSTTGWTDPACWCSKMETCPNRDWAAAKYARSLPPRRLQTCPSEAALSRASRNHPSILPKATHPPSWRRAAALWPPSPHGESPPAPWCWAPPRLRGRRMRTDRQGRRRSRRRRRRSPRFSHQRRTLWSRRRSWRRAGWSSRSSPAAPRRQQHTTRSRASSRWGALMEERRRQPAGRERRETAQLPPWIPTTSRAPSGSCPRIEAPSSARWLRCGSLTLRRWCAWSAGSSLRSPRGGTTAAPVGRWAKKKYMSSFKCRAWTRVSLCDVCVPPGLLCTLLQSEIQTHTSGWQRGKSLHLLPFNPHQKWAMFLFFLSFFFFCR